MKVVKCVINFLKVALHGLLEGRRLMQEHFGKRSQQR
jgi:hypothetical protein